MPAGLGLDRALGAQSGVHGALALRGSDATTYFGPKSGNTRSGPGGSQEESNCLSRWQRVRVLSPSGDIPYLAVEMASG
jgi:hypothetical protein